MLKLALIGCGRIAKRHSELLGLNQIEGAELAAVCDNVFDKAKKIGIQFGVPAYADMEELMQKENIDAAVVLTPSGLHAEHVINLAKYGKDIIVEAKDSFSIKCTDFILNASETISIEAGSSIDVKSDGYINQEASGPFDIQASTVNIT